MLISDNNTTTTKAAAQAALDKGFSIFPLAPKSKIPRAGSSGHKDASYLEKQVEAWWEETPDANVGVACGASKLIVLDFDSGAAPRDLNLPKTYTVRSAKGFHYYFWGTAATTKMFHPISGALLGDLKSEGGYVLGEGSVHPDGPIYTVADNSAVADAPFDIIAKLIPKAGQKAQPAAGQRVPLGQHDSTLTFRAGQLRHANVPQDLAEEMLIGEVEELYDGYGSDYREMVKKCVGSIYKHPAGPSVPDVLIEGRLPGEAVVQPASAAPAPAQVQVPTKFVGPDIPEKAFYGLAGRIISKLRPNTESHPMGNLLELLACFGNIVGGNAFYKIEDSLHYCNINVVTVGKSSKARKGTGQQRINRIVRDLDSNWFSQRRTSGLGSGEVVISLVRDRQIGPVKKKNGDMVIEVTDVGVDDKRLFISEGEFAGILAVANRKDNLLSKVIRDSWDHLAIRNMAKSGSSICENPHISISANITQEELLLQMREADRFNGFGNRFLWCYVERQGLLPHGGEEIDWSEEIKELFKCVEFTKKQQRIFMDRNAREMWNRIYEELSEDVGGLVGAVTSRGEAQVIRLALLFAMPDCSDHITSDHLKAARAVWIYCEDSARLIFGGTTKEQLKLLQFLAGDPKSTTTIREDLYQRHRVVEEIQKDIDRLIEMGRVIEKKDASGKPVYSPAGS